MAEQLSKLRPDRDLQCYFQRPSAAAAMSEASESGFTLSGCWRQQFDWAVVDWTRDNTFEHPALRNLPDGDLSGIQLSYEEVRTNCIAMDSTLYPTVDWPSLRIWAAANGGETLYKAPLAHYATPVGGFSAATVQFELQGTPSSGDYIELAWLDQHFNHRLAAGETLESAVSVLAAAIAANQATCGVTASAEGTQITLTYDQAAGANANRIGVYGTVHGTGTESWAPAFARFGGGTSPERWRVDLNLGNLHDANGVRIPMTDVRKMRWTWSADLQDGDFQRSEFSVVISNWTVSGSNLGYRVAGPGSRRIEDDAPELAFEGVWNSERGNYSGGSIRSASVPGSCARCSYQANGQHRLFLGTRRLPGAASVTVQVDGGAPINVALQLDGEDMLVRLPLGTFSGGTHSVTVTHNGPANTTLWFDFLEIAYDTADLPDFDVAAQQTLATDWDTDHSIALPAERTAWLIRKLGFNGRANHYAGAMWFYELNRAGHTYASGTITFSGSPEFGKRTVLTVASTPIEHLNLIGETAESIATCFALLINAGSTGVRASAAGATLTITSRIMGAAGNAIDIDAQTNSTVFSAEKSGATLAGGNDGVWRTDLGATPRINRAARDWTRAYLNELHSAGIDATAAFSMEVQHGDDTVAAGIAQRYPDGKPALLNTPALQTNFGPESTAFWREVYREMAGIMTDAGLRPYLQFGEVQWWYFANSAGMPFYDAGTTSAFQALYGRAMRVVTSQNADPNLFTQECAFLAERIGQFTDSLMSYVRQSYPTARFEVLYPPDVNDTPLNRLINYPAAHWTPSRLDSLKTENFTYTGDRDLDKARQSIDLPMQLGFARSQASHLVGIGEYTTPWSKEQRLAVGEQMESVVLFALDQFCLIGYGLPLDRGARRAQYFGD